MVSGDFKCICKILSVPVLIVFGTQRSQVQILSHRFLAGAPESLEIEGSGLFLFLFSKRSYPRACLKNHSRHLHPPLSVIFAPNSVNVARYASLIWHKSPTKCGIHLPKSIFQTRSSDGGNNCPGKQSCMEIQSAQGKHALWQCGQAKALPPYAPFPGAEYGL